MDTGLFILGKLVAVLLRIETWLAVLAVLSIVAQLRGRYRVGLTASVATAALLIGVSVLPVGTWALRPLEAAYPARSQLPPVDGIILLGGAEDVAASRHWGGVQIGEAGERLTAVAELARRFPAARVVLAGGGGRLRDVNGVVLSEARIAAAFMAAQGIPANRLILEEGSRNTTENARQSLAAVAPIEGQVWVLVTSAYHMPRARQSFQAAGWAGVIPYPVDHRTAGVVDGIGWNLAANLDLLNIALREWVGLAAYRLIGR